MARPRLPENQLLHPRKLRKSTTKGQRLDVPTPSQRTLKKWKPIVDMCVAAVATNESLHLQPIKNKVRLKFWKNPPKGFPKSRIVDEVDGWLVCEYNAEILLLWMWERKLADLCPNDIYTLRSSYLKSLAQGVNNYVDVSYVEEYYSDL